MSGPEDDEPDTDDTTFSVSRQKAAEAPASSPAPVDPAVGSLGAPVSLERYTVRRQLGRGAMGEVHLCKDNRIGRDVAMKVILPSNQSDAQARARFVREARVQGQLEHPSIVPVYDLGVDAMGSIFFTMKSLRGMTLAQIIRGLRNHDRDVVQSFPLRRLLSAFGAACLAVDFAHCRGVLHRDLKPANIMLGDFGEVYVLDWGIAKLKEADGESIAVETPLDEDIQTAADKILGTFGYMSPEQALGTATALDARSDVYSLGAILFEILTFQTLHPRDTWNAMLASTLKGANAQASARAPERDIPPELDAICLKATKLHPEERYASARDLHAAVERFLDGDKDVEVRRQMALKHARAAEEAASEAVAGGPRSEDARRKALREVARALAFDPTNVEAMHALGRIVTAPPREVPNEVIAELAAVGAAHRRLRIKEGVKADLGGLGLLVPLSLWMGVRSWAVLSAIVLLTLGAMAAKLVAARMENDRSAHQWIYLAYLLNTLGLVCVGRTFGPLLFMPMLLAMVTFAYCMSSATRYRWAVIVTGCVALLGSVALELSGVIGRSYMFHEGALTILPDAVAMPEAPTLAALTLSSFFLMIVPGLIMGRLQKALREAQQSSFMHAWHLRQLLPDQANAHSRTARGN